MNSDPGRSELLLRELLWLRHGCDGAALYGDDGEMQCCSCVIDFKRSSPEDIQAQFIAIGRAKLEKAQKPEPVRIENVLILRYGVMDSQGDVFDRWAVSAQEPTVPVYAELGPDSLTPTSPIGQAKIFNKADGVYAHVEIDDVKKIDHSMTFVIAGRAVARGKDQHITGAVVESLFPSLAPSDKGLKPIGYYSQSTPERHRYCQATKIIGDDIVACARAPGHDDDLELSGDDGGDGHHFLRGIGKAKK